LGDQGVHKGIYLGFTPVKENPVDDVSGLLVPSWEQAGAEQRARVQTLLFGDSLLYSKESGFLNTSNSSLFNVLQEISTENGMLAFKNPFHEGLFSLVSS
jgi:hypothetical protein